MENNYVLDTVNRRVIINYQNQEIVINEFDKVEKVFLKNTSDVYECELVILDTIITDDTTDKEILETKAYIRRVGNEQWLMDFNLTDYVLIK